MGRFGVGRLRPVKKVKRWLFKKFQPASGEAWGMTFRLDPVYGFTDPLLYKKPVADLLREKIKEGAVVLDVGANIGLFTCLMAKLAGPKGKVYAFEPEPKNLELLRENVSRNGLNNVVVLRKGLSDKPGVSKVAPGGAHAAFGGSEEDSGSAEAELVRLDDIPEVAAERVALVKMDIIGYEAKALGGMRGTLLRNKNAVILSAFCPEFLKRAGDNGEKYLRGLSELGFRIFQIKPEGLSEIVPGAFGEFAKRYNPRFGISQAEIFCSRD